MCEIMRKKTDEINNYADLITSLLNYNNNYDYDTPRTDIIKKGDEYIIEILLAGVDKKDININIENDLLKVECERKEYDDDFKFEVKESYYGKIRKLIKLPDFINKEKIDATTVNGILRIILPKNDKDKNRNIPIK